MEITMTIQELVFLVLGIAGIVLVCYLIGLAKQLTSVAKHAVQVLEDTEVITGIAAEKAQELDGALDNAVETVNVISELVKGNQSTIKAATNAVNSFAGLKAFFSGKKSEKGKKTDKTA